MLDEWDCIYNQEFVTEEDKDSFTKFLSNLLKDNAYVEMAYMTGILPIAKYSSGSELSRMLAATKAGDITTMTELMEYAHNTHSPLQSYSNEAELASIIRWVYLKALDFYRIEREDKAGVGYVDFIFYPFVKSEDAIIIELKVNHIADENSA